jgi:hypothetical protein
MSNIVNISHVFVKTGTWGPPTGPQRQEVILLSQKGLLKYYIPIERNGSVSKIQEPSQIGSWGQTPNLSVRSEERRVRNKRITSTLATGYTQVSIKEFCEMIGLDEKAPMFDKDIKVNEKPDHPFKELPSRLSDAPEPAKALSNDEHLTSHEKPSGGKFTHLFFRESIQIHGTVNLFRFTVP